MERFKLVAGGAIAILVLTAPAALAVPITYNAQLFDGIDEFGSISPSNSADDPVGAQYFSFFATAGSPITITGMRLENDYDMSLWVFQGLFGDTNDFGPNFSFADPNLVVFADDEIPHPGPFGDPLAIFAAPSTGFYTVAVTNFASGPNAGANGLFEFKLTATGVSVAPEPASLALWTLLGIGGVGCGLRRWRKRRRVDG